MNKGINLAISDFKESLVKEVNTCGLPASVVSLCLKELLVQVDNLTMQEIEKERNMLKEGE